MKQLSTLFYGGRIYTVDERIPVCDAMIIQNDRITWLGSASELSAVPSDAYEMVDLDGSIILPGFIDSHTHLCSWALSRRQIDLDGATSYARVLSIVRRHVDQLPSGDRNWVIGRGWKKEQWSKITLPHRSDLDKITSDRPVMLLSKDEHLLWVNSKALKVAGIGKDTPDQEGGRIDRDPSGEPTGLLRENAAWKVFGLYNPPTGKQMATIMREGFEEMFRQGCVGATTFDRIDGFETLQTLDVAGKLPVKVVHYLPVDSLEHVIKLRLKTGFGSEFLKVGGIKTFADGSLGSQTALMLKPYESGRATKGIEVTGVNELREIIKICARSGLTCAIHAIGDRANRNVLDAIEASGRRMSKRFPHRIEHCQILSKRDIKRFKTLNVVASMQPSHATVDIDLMEIYLGNRCKDSYRFRTLSRLGITLCFGSDAPIEPLNPLAGIQAAVVGTHTGGGKCFNPKETIKVIDAIRGFTLEGAVAVGQQHQRGSLAVGKKADLIVLDRDIIRSKPMEIMKAKILATYINGKMMFNQDGFPQ